MKKTILSLLIFLPFIALSQSESDEKKQKRVERLNPPNSYDNNTTIIVPNNNRPIIYPYHNRYSPYNPYYGPSRPYSYGYGYNPLKISVGLTSGFGEYPTSVGGYMSIGSENAFFIFSYESSKRLPYDRGNTNNRVLWDNISRDDALYWNDEELDRFLQYSSFDFGVGGKLTDKFSPFITVGFYDVNGEFVFYDETGSLQSPNNEYMIHDDFEDGLSLRIGSFYHINSVNIGTSVSIFKPIRINTFLGFTF